MVDVNCLSVPPDGDPAYGLPASNDDRSVLLVIEVVSKLCMLEIIPAPAEKLFDDPALGFEIDGLDK
ncbi:MAG: hypothetical protein WBW87_05585 [Candidatus Cybelea sp.]